MKKYILLFVLLFATITVSAQIKIGYANLEFILKNMPEAQQMNREIMKYQKMLEEQILAKQQYYQSLLNDYAKKEKSGYSESLLKNMQSEIMSLEQEIQNDAVNADAQLNAMSAQKLEPITKKIIDAISRVYEEDGYTFIFNSADGTGNSIVLKGPENANLTFRVLEELGVEIKDK